MEPLTLALISAGSGILGGILNSGESPQEKEAKIVQRLIKAYLPQAEKTAFSKAEINALIKTMQSLYGGAANVAAGQIGAALGESGITGGQGFAEYYTQALAPVIAHGQEESAKAQLYGNQLYEEDLNNTRQRVAQLLSLLVGNTQSFANQTNTQKIASGFLSGANIGATALGNIGSAYRDFNYTPIDTNYEPIDYSNYEPLF